MKTALPEMKLNIKNGAVVYTVTSGWRADFIGADFPQVVDDELNIHTPLSDMNIVLSFKCTKGSETVEKEHHTDELDQGHVRSFQKSI